jgi:DNA polymerase-3 subunit epsilon
MNILKQLNLDRPLCIFSLETTGLSFENDEIIEIKIKKINLDNSFDYYHKLYNPTVDISKEASEINGYTNEMLKNKPLFIKDIPNILSFLKDYHIAGYNITKFHLPFFLFKLKEQNIIFNFRKNNRQIFDINQLFRKAYKPNSLEFAYNYISGLDSKDKIIMSEVVLENSLSHLSKDDISDKYYDFSGKILKKDDDLYFNFGKYKDRRVLDIIEYDLDYIKWIMKSDLPLDTKIIIHSCYLTFKNINNE